MDCKPSVNDSGEEVVETMPEELSLEPVLGSSSDEEKGDKVQMLRKQMKLNKQIRELRTSVSSKSGTGTILYSPPQWFNSIAVDYYDVPPGRAFTTLRCKDSAPFKALLHTLEFQDSASFIRSY